MGRPTAIGVDDDLAAREARVAIGAADHELARGVHVELVFRREPAIGQNLLDVLTHDFAKLFLLGFFLVLGRHDHGTHANRLVVLVGHGDLTLRIRLQKRAAGVTRLGHALQDLVRIVDRRRHQIRRLGAGIPEHDALVARAFVLVSGSVHALRNMGGLLMQQDFDVGGLPVEALLLVSDVLDRLASRFLDLVLGDRFRATHFAGQHHLVGGGQAFAGHTGIRITRKVKIEHGIGNPVANLIGMPFGN